MSEAPMDGEDLCVCGTPVSSGAGSFVLECSGPGGCLRTWHSGCAHVGPEQFDLLRKRVSDRRSWLCPDCEGSASSSSSVDEVLEEPGFTCCVCKNKIPSFGPHVGRCSECNEYSHWKCNQVKKVVWRKYDLEAIPSCFACRIKSSRPNKSKEAKNFERFSDKAQKKCPEGWQIRSHNEGNDAQDFRGFLLIHKIAVTGFMHPVVSLSVNVGMFGSLSISVHGNRMGADIPFFADHSDTIRPAEMGEGAVGPLLKLLSDIDKLTVCPGNRDPHTVGLVTEGLVDIFRRESTLIYQDTDFGDGGGEDRRDVATVRSSQCELLIESPKMGRPKQFCPKCRVLGTNLRRTELGGEPDDDAQFKKLCRSALIRKLKERTEALRSSRESRAELERRVDELIRKNSIPVDDALETLLLEVLESMYFIIDGNWCGEGWLFCRDELGGGGVSTAPDDGPRPSSADPSSQSQRPKAETIPSHGEEGGP